MNSGLAPTATFTQNTITYTLTPAITGQGTITSTDGKINCTSNGSTMSGSCSASYAAGTQVTMNAAPAAGWTSQGWSGFCSGGNPCNVTMNSNYSPRATFTGPTYMLTPAITGQGTITSTDGMINCTSNGSTVSGSCSASYTAGTQVTMNAAPATGWTSQGWSGSAAKAIPAT